MSNPPLFKRPGFWLLIPVLGLITALLYADSFNWLTDDIISRYSLIRALYLLPIIWAGFLFGWKGAAVTCGISFICMLPRIIFVSTDAIEVVETIGVVFIGGIISTSFISLSRERQYRHRLEMVQQNLQSSRERYRQIFDNARDSIVVHDLRGNMVAVNRATEQLHGLTREEIMKMKSMQFVQGESLERAREVGRKLLRNEPVEQPYAQQITRKDGTTVDMQISTSLVYDKGKPVAFQHIGRDVTEQKRQDDNLHFYLQQATRAQEEERKRISLELHDDTIQSLIVLSRRLDALSDNKELPENVKAKVEELWQMTDSILQGVRRLSQDLRPAAIDRLGLLPAIEWAASNVKEYAGIDTNVTIIGEERRLPEEVAVTLFRITQEALSNIRRHSGATKAEITVEFDEDLFRITISDNGKGFDTPGKIGDLAKFGRLGLAGMQERANLVGGKLSVVSEPGKGTTITVEAPG